jgi:para-nitrobenzyl esterase
MLLRQISVVIVLLSIAGLTKAFFEIASLRKTSMTPPRAAAQTYLRANIDSGVVEGSVSSGVRSFKGIPYAAPPLNQYRWRAPQPVTPWAGVRDATAFGHECMQTPGTGDAAVSRAAFAEDCLVLNVWGPFATAPNEELPVLVWIHGGGYVTGGSSPAIYDGSSFARHGIVFVSFNYRLGRFGFFAHPALIKANEGLVGNFALMDQIAALRWVKRNIGAFGGNPDEVTLMGESAGGISVLALLSSPRAKGLFHRAIVLSGGGRTLLLGGKRLTGGTAADPSADQIGERFAAGLGIEGDGPQTLEALRAIPAQTVLGGLNKYTYVGGPIFDDNILSGTPQAMLSRHEVAPMPIMIGTTTEDLSLVLPPAENPLSYFGPNLDKARAAYNPKGKLDATQARLVIGADMTMHEPARFLAKQITGMGTPVWIYRFGYVAESLRSKHAAAAHASELPFLFDTMDARYGEAVTDKDRVVAQSFNSYVTNFVKSGQPNVNRLPSWPKFDSVRSELMAFTEDGGLIVLPDPWKDRLDLIEQTVDPLANAGKGG